MPSLAFDFPTGSLVLTEAGSKRRASLHVFAAKSALHSIDPGGVEIFSTDLDGFRAALTAENRTLKRALTDPRLISGVGNAYSDEILHAAQLSPIALTHKLKPEEWERLFAATRAITHSLDRPPARRSRKSFPEKVTAFRPEFAVHGKLRPALPALRPEGAAHPLRRQRNQLLRPLPDRRQGSGRPQPFAAAGLRLAAHSRRAGSPEAPLKSTASRFFLTAAFRLVPHSDCAALAASAGDSTDFLDALVLREPDIRFIAEVSQ